MKLLKLLLTIVCISGVHPKAFSLVEETFSTDIEAQLEMLLIQCENRQFSDDCHKFGIEVILGKTTEEIQVPEETLPVIQQPEVFDQSTSLLNFSGTVNNFNFTLPVLSQLDLIQKCHQQEDNLFPQVITNFELKIDERVFASRNEADGGASNRRQICERLQQKAVEENLPFNHLESKVISGTMQGVPYYFPYSDMNTLFATCKRFWKSHIRRNVDNLYYSIDGAEPGTRHQEYNSSHYWRTDEATCNVLVNGIKKYIPQAEW